MQQAGFRGESSTCALVAKVGWVLLGVISCALGLKLQRRLQPLCQADALIELPRSPICPTLLHSQACFQVPVILGILLLLFELSCFDAFASS